MTKTTTLLLLGAIMVIVASLVGKDGTVANVASMDQDRLAAAINDQGESARTAQPTSPVQSEMAEPAEIVSPTIVDEADFDMEETASEEVPVEDLGIHTAESDGIDTAAFDPRIG